MAALAWMLAWTLSGLSLVLPAMVDLPTPINVTLTSHHFEHILRWQQGAGTPPGATYRVSVIRDTDRLTSWRTVPSCIAVRDPLVCNLTLVFTDPLQGYFTSVRAELPPRTSNNATYGVFRPIQDTVLGPPLPSVASCGRHLCVHLQPPQQHLQHVYERLKFRVNVSRDGVIQFSHEGVPLKGLVVYDVGPGRLYCVWASVSDPDERQQSEFSQPKCLTTSNTFNTDVLVSVLLCLLLIGGVVIVALMFFAGFFCLRRRPLPSVLTSLRHIQVPPLLTLPFASSFASLHVVDVVAPPAGQKRSHTSSLSEHSEEESDNESGAGGGAYLIKGGALCSSSSTASSSSACPLLSNCPGAPAPPAGDEHSAGTAPPAGDKCSAETAPPAGDKCSAETAPPAGDKCSAETAPPAGDKCSTETAPPAGDKCSAETAPPAGDKCSAETAPPAGDECSAETAPPAGDEWSGGGGGACGLDVNLLTLTFGPQQGDNCEGEREEQSVIRPSPWRVSVEDHHEEEDDDRDGDDDDEDDDDDDAESSGYIRH